MSNQTLETIIDKVFSCTTIVQAHTTKETSKPTQYTITLKSPKEMGAKLGLAPAAITITIKAEADLAKELFPQDHAFKITFQKTELHHYNPNPDNSQRDSRQSTLTSHHPNNNSDNDDDDNQNTTKTETQSDTELNWSFETETNTEYPIDDSTCEAPNQ